MPDLPILFSAPMVRGLIREVEQPGTGKTQTRRILNPQPVMHPAGDCTIGGHRGAVDYLMREIYPKHMARIRKGDRLWVREEHYRFGHWEPVPGVRTKGRRQKWRFVADRSEVLYEAPPLFRKGRHHSVKESAEPFWYKRLARFMPRAMSRMTLTVTDVRAECLQDCSEASAEAEGVTYLDDGPGAGFWVVEGTQVCAEGSVEAYAQLWEHINGDGSWVANPWIVSLTFTVECRNIEAIPVPYLIWSNVHGAWWGTNRAGYFTELASAGRYTRGEAIKQCAYGRDGFTASRTPPELPVREIDAINRGGQTVDDLVLKADRAECRALDLARKTKLPA